MKGDRNLKLKLAVLLTSQWYYLITPLAAKQYHTTEEPGQELHKLHTRSRRSAGECISSGLDLTCREAQQLKSLWTDTFAENFCSEHDSKKHCGGCSAVAVFICWYLINILLFNLFFGVMNGWSRHCHVTNKSKIKCSTFMQSGSNKTFEILSNGIVKFLQEMGIFWPLHSLGVFFICSFSVKFWV